MEMCKVVSFQWIVVQFFLLSLLLLASTTETISSDAIQFNQIPNSSKIFKSTTGSIIRLPLPTTATTTTTATLTTPLYSSASIEAPSVLPSLEKSSNNVFMTPSPPSIQLISSTLLIAPITSDAPPLTATTLPPPLSTTTTTTTTSEFSAPHTTYKCPDQCDCFNIDETIDCSHRGLNILPSFSFNTKRLYLEDNRVSYIPLDSFSSAPELLLIVLERNEVTYVDTSSFCGLSKLQELDLGGNRIQSFVVSSYKIKINQNYDAESKGNQNQHLKMSKNVNDSCTLPNLKEINLSLNLLVSVPKLLSIFAPNLEILNLSYNEIEIVTVDNSYTNLKFLKHLDLSRNKIHWISYSDLRPLKFTSLEILNLAECGVTGVDEGSFDGLNSLSSLSLANNLLNPVDVCSILKSFSKRRNVTVNQDKVGVTNNVGGKPKEPYKDRIGHTYIDVNSNYSLYKSNFSNQLLNESTSNNNKIINKFSSDNNNNDKNIGGVEAYTENFNYAKENENYDRIIDDGDEDDYNSLTRLDLSEIPLPNITRLMLGAFKRLIILDLSICDVEWIEPELFSDLANLETLHLEFGKLIELKNLAYHKKLRRLYLQDNKLKNISVTGVYTLETLDLSYNKIESIPKDWLVGLRNLQILNLSHNNILSVSWNALKQSSIMLTLDISFNKLSSLNNFGLNRLTKLDASHNSITTFDHDTFEHLHQTISGIDLSYNNISTFDALIFKQSHNLQTLNLAYNKLFKWDNNDINNNNNINNNNADNSNYNDENNENNYHNIISPFANLQLLKNLDLSGNELTKLTCQTFLPLRNMLKLNLRDNKFTDVRNTGVNCARSLIKLVLSNNKMASVDVTILESMLSLEELDISSNPFNCDCNIVPFLRWANETRVRIIKEVETDNYKCYYDVSNQQHFLQNNYADTDDNNDDDRNFLFSYRPELDNCFNGDSNSDGNNKKQQKYFSYIPDFDNLLSPSLQYQDPEGDKNQNSYLPKSGSIKYFSVFCLTTLAGIFIGMAVIFVAWRFRTSVYTIKCFSPRWRRVRYREVADDLESALDSRV